MGKKLIAILIRKVAGLILLGGNFWRITYLRLKYPGLKINFSSKIGKNCKVVCVDGGHMEIINCSIEDGVYLFADMNATVSIMNTLIGRNSVIVAKESIIIKSGCAIAEMVVIRDQDHQVNIADWNEPFSNYSTGKIVINENVWIASKATILKNVTIGMYSVIAASAVVNKNIPAFQIWGGVPANFLKHVDSSKN